MKPVYESFMTPVDSTLYPGSGWTQTQNSTQDIWTLANAAGQTVLVVTVTYTDSTKGTVSTIVRT